MGCDEKLLDSITAGSGLNVGAAASLEDCYDIRDRLAERLVLMDAVTEGVQEGHKESHRDEVSHHDGVSHHDWMSHHRDGTSQQ